MRIKRLPAGLIGALGLIACVELVISRRSDRLATYEVLSTRFALAAASSEVAGSDVLALGDSVIKLGFDPATFERRHGRRAYNLAVPGTPPPLTYALLRRALAAGAAPKALVIGHLSLSGDPRIEAAEFAEVLNLGECAELSWKARDPALFATLATNRLLPSLRYRHAVRMRLMSALRGTDPLSDPNAEPWERWRANQGMDRVEGPSFGGRMDARLEQRITSSEWRVLSLYEQYVRKIARLAAERGIAVYWLVPPLAPDAQARRDALGFDAHHSRNLKAIQARSPNLILLDARHSGYPASAFVDTCHLNAKGAETLTREIADAIARKAGGETWVTLPAYDDRPSRIAVEVAPDKVPR